MNERISTSIEKQDINNNKITLIKNFGKLVAMAFIASCAVNYITYLAFQRKLSYTFVDYVK